MRHLLAALTLCATPLLSQAQSPVEFNFGHGFSSSSLHHQAAESFSQELAKLSNGNMKAHVFHSGQLGNAREMFEGLQLGTLELTWVPTARITGFAPELEIFDLPYIFDDMDDVAVSLDGPLGNKILDKLAAQQVTGLGFYIDGFKAMTANRALNEPQDFKGVKFRTMESDMVMNFYRALGADPVPMDYAEVYNGLQMRTIDGQENPIVLIHDMRFYEVQDHLTMSEHAVLAGVLVASTDWFEQLSPENQAALRAASKSLVSHQRELAKQVEASNLHTIESHGVKVKRLTAAEKAKFKEATQHLRSNYEKKHGTELTQLLDAS